MGSIYKITNTVNGKAYIGQTRYDAEKTRISKHLNGRGNEEVKKDIEKYGKDAFTYEILHDGIIPEFLADLEKDEIEKHNTLIPHGYNFRTSGRGGACSEETKRKISEANKGRTPWNKGKKGVTVSPMKGKRHTPESRQKMSENRKGISSWNKGVPSPYKGVPRSEDTKRKIGKAHKGKKLSENTKRSISESKKGGRLSLEHRRKLSKANTGQNNAFYGKKHTPESRQKISLSKKGHTPWNKGKKGLQTAWNKGKKVSNPHWLGRKHTDESRRKMSESTKGQTAWNKGKKGVYTDEALRRMSKARETPERVAAREFFFSLPREMDIAEKRKHLRQKFPDVNHCKIWKWCKKFDLEV